MMTAFHSGSQYATYGCVLGHLSALKKIVCSFKNGKLAFWKAAAYFEGMKQHIVLVVNFSSFSLNQINYCQP